MIGLKNPNPRHSMIRIPILLLLLILLTLVPAGLFFAEPVKAQYSTSPLNSNVTVDFEYVSVSGSYGSYSATEYIIEDTVWPYLSGTYDSIDIYLVSTDNTSDYGDVYFYFEAGTLNLVGVDATGGGGQEGELAIVFSNTVPLVQSPGNYQYITTIDYYENYTYVFTSDATLYLSIGETTTYNAVVEGYGETSITCIPISLYLYIQSTFANLTVIDGYYATDVGAFIKLSALDLFEVDQPTIHGYSLQTQPPTEGGGGASPSPGTGGGTQQASEEGGGGNDIVYGIAGLAFIVILAGGAALLVKRARKPKTPEYTFPTTPPPPPPTTPPATTPRPTPPPPNIQVRTITEKAPAGGKVKFELTVPAGAVPGTLQVKGPQVDKMFRVVSPGVKTLELPAPTTPGTYNYRFTFTRGGVTTEFVVSTTVVEAKPKVKLETTSISAAPLAEIKIPVEVECPIKCKVQIEAPSGLQAIIEPEHAFVEGKKKVEFKLRLGSEALAGSYTLSVKTEPPTEEARIQITVTEPATPALVPGYEVLRKLGTGGFATVYLARRQEDDTLVALKVPKIELGETISGELMDRFKREAETWSKLQHKHIVRLVDHGLRPIPYLAMEYMEGGTLREKLEEKGKLDPREAIQLAFALGDALSYAHHMGVIHRDIKLENVLYTRDGTPKLSDWGLVKVMLEASTRSGGGFKGTLLYAAPEQVDPQKYGQPDWRTDIYQFGALLYETLTGTPPLKGESMLELVNAILNKEPVPPSRLNPEVPRWLDEIIMKALAKQKEERWNSIDVMVYEMKKRLGGA